MRDKIQKVCKKHGLVAFRKEGRGTNERFRCTKCRSEAVDKKRKKLKLQAVEYKGGKCKYCDYNNCVEALEFHHRNPNQKDFGIGSGNTKSWEKIKKEIDKCDLLCSNCHKELHAKLHKKANEKKLN